MTISTRFWNPVALGIFAAAISGALFGQSTNLPKADHDFAMEAASGGMAEVKLGQLAEQKAASQSVKTFGARMEKDHSAAGEKLKEAAAKNNYTVPDDLNANDRDTYDRLSQLSGPEFDKAYADDMVQDHVKDVAAFKKEASSGKNPDIRNFASQTLPTLEDHLRMARDMQKSVATGY